MMLRTACPGLCVLSLWLNSVGNAQVSSFPYTQDFDSVVMPALPAGWSSSQNRSPGTNDFTTSGTAHSSPNAALSTNATIGQSLVSPLFDFRNVSPDRMTFYTRRSGTHNARVVVEASPDSGQTFSVQVGDTLTNTNPNNYVLVSSVIPGSLANRAGVQFRWRILPDAGGNTGTFRIDDVIVTAQTTHDLAMAGLWFDPVVVSGGDSVRAVARVRNAGLQQALLFQVMFYLDLNNDSIPQPSELINSVSNLRPLDVGDSLDVSAFAGCFPPGNTGVIAQLVYALDQNPSNDRRLAVLRVGYSRRSVVVNEIMYAPTGTEPEWVELYNTRADSVDIKDWLVSDSNVLVRKLITPSHLMLPPSGYVVLTKDSAALVDIRPLIPSRVIDVPGFPTLNNTGDAVVLYDNRAATMDSVAYLPGWGGSTGGKSLERIDPQAISTAQTNWSTSRHPERGTPGLRNSVSRKDYDLVLDTMLLSPPRPVHGDSVIVTLRIRNAGFQPAAPYTLRLYDDVNRDSLPEPGEMVSSVERSSPVAPLDSLPVSFPAWRPGGNDQMLIGVAVFPPDEDSSNNRAFVEVRPGYRAGSAVISEIMYSPVGEPEWMELYNTTAENIDVKDWKISNRFTTNLYTVTAQSAFIPPGGYAVIVKDTTQLLQRYARLPGLLVQASSMPTYLFNNSGDAAVVFDNRGEEVDSVRYSPAWGGSDGTSLERIDMLGDPDDSSNWTSSVDSMRATPGRENSVAVLDLDLQAMRRLPFVSPPGVPAVLSLTVRNIGRLPVPDFDVAFFDDGNHDSVAGSSELITRVHVTQPLARRDTMRVAVPWPDPRPGIHVIIARAEYTPDMRPANNCAIFAAKIGYLPAVVVVNEVMYAPLTGEAEYVELVNTSGSDVDLSGWMLSDRPGASGAANEFPLVSYGRPLRPGEFFVIGSDSSICSRFRYLDSLQLGLLTICDESSLGLNNDGDAVVIRDATHSTIDSVAYLPSWHSPAVTDAAGRSLERIHPGLGSNDARNWSSCVLSIGGTPGAPNSIFSSSVPGKAKISCSPNPFSPDGDGHEDFSVIHYEIPVDVASVSVKIYDVKGRLIRYLVNNEPGGARRDVVWDGYDDERQKARIGMYVVLLEGLNDRGGNVYSAKGVVVLAARL